MSIQYTRYSNKSETTASNNKSAKIYDKKSTYYLIRFAAKPSAGSERKSSFKNKKTYTLIVKRML